MRSTGRDDARLRTTPVQVATSCAATGDVGAGRTRQDGWRPSGCRSPRRQGRVGGDGSTHPPPARRQRRRLPLTPQIVERTDGTAGFVVPARRRVAERTLSRLMRSCRLVRDYGTLPARREVMVLWPMAMLLSGRPAGRLPVGFRRPAPRERGTLPAAPGVPALAPPGVSPSIAVPRLSPAPYPARERQPGRLAGTVRGSAGPTHQTPRTSAVPRQQPRHTNYRAPGPVRSARPFRRLTRRPAARPLRAAAAVR
jgi:hypothetical protein